MIIGIDASRANRKHKTGTEWYAYYLIRQFAQIDDKNEYILYTDTPLTEGLFDLIQKEYKKEYKPKEDPKYDEDGFQILESPHNNFKAKVLKWPFKFFWTLGGLSLEMLLHKPDVLFVPSHVLPIIHPKKSIVTIHDIGFIKDSTLFAKDDIGPDILNAKYFLKYLVKLLTLGKYEANSFDYLKWSTLFALKKAHKIITVSHFSKKEITDCYPYDTDKIQVVYNGFNKDLYKQMDDDAVLSQQLEKYGIEKPYFFYIGRLEKKKNITTLIEAYAILRERDKSLKHKLVLVGDASYGYDEIKYMTREFDIVDDVIIPGWLDEEIIPYIYNGADAFVFPSKYEGFGIPLLQAMACGTPMAASRVSSIPEVAGEAAVYFNPDYALSIADAMHKIINDKNYTRDLVEKGLERSKSYSWRKCAIETLDIICK